MWVLLLLQADTFLSTIFLNIGFGFLRSLCNMVLDLFLDIVDLNSVRGFDLNFDLILLFKKIGLVFIFQCCVLEF